MTDETPQIPTTAGYRHFDTATGHGHVRSDAEVGGFTLTDEGLAALVALGANNG